MGPIHNGSELRIGVRSLHLVDIVLVVGDHAPRPGVQVIISRFNVDEAYKSQVSD